MINEDKTVIYNLDEKIEKNKKNVFCSENKDDLKKQSS
jgi:hypothetical protein